MIPVNYKKLHINYLNCSHINYLNCSLRVHHCFSNERAADWKNSMCFLFCGHTYFTFLSIVLIFLWLKTTVVRLLKVYTFFSHKTVLNNSAGIPYAEVLVKNSLNFSKCDISMCFNILYYGNIFLKRFLLTKC